ncbi:uncharacterized protein LOC120474475 isoform X3 [Pimephales promelas]|uniref:uncharacterized protein LOC120474475 isoform X3 n=1 Tax=Pimephales promelas TaxID=90988 RepID=UPI0019559A6A|nr:uncharacterized protein LOC120474475 isoform X3 [Pimephales promelas]
MLVKVKLGDGQKFVKIYELSLKEFLSAAFLKFGVPTVPKNVKVVDESGTEVDEDVFEEVVKDPSVGVLTIKYADLESASPQASPVQLNVSLSSSIDSTEDTAIIEESPSSKRIRLDDEAKKLVESILLHKPGGEHIINEYNRFKTLGDETRRKMVKILAADMTEKNGTSPSRQVKEKYARGIVSLFPYLSDPLSKKGYEHYYDGENGTGYLAWRIKTIQRGRAKERRASFDGQGLFAEGMSGGPTVKQEEEFTPETILSEDECKEAIAFRNHSADVLTIKHGADMESPSPQASPVQLNVSLYSSIDSTDSQDTVIIEESSSSKRIRLDDEAKKLVESILVHKPGGEHIINEYNRFKTLGDEMRRKMVKILAADMTEKNGTSPSRQVKEKYARGIVSLFPYLSDPLSKKGYEHFYDSENGTGYLAWRIKTIQRGRAKERRASFDGQRLPAEGMSGGPTARREAEFTPETVLSEDECKEAIAFMNHSANEDAVKKNMKLTFDYRRDMVLDPMLSSDVLTVFPRFKDVKGLIEQDFVLMFGEGMSGKLLEKWTTAFKKKVIQQCKKLPTTSYVGELLLAAESPSDDSEDCVNFVWDSDLSSIILLLHLIPPPAQGRKRPGKVSASQAEKHLVVFKKSGTNIEEHLRNITASAQPYLLAVGPQKKSVHQYFIILDQHAIPCKSTSSLGAFDELFKAHFVFGTSYNTMLHNMYTFIQTTVYNIDVGKVKESPRVAEIRARLLS